MEQFKKEVGKYATTNGMEFVAEVFAGMVHGKTYSDRVMMVYKSLHGPDVPLRPAAEVSTAIATPLHRLVRTERFHGYQ